MRHPWKNSVGRNGLRRWPWGPLASRIGPRRTGSVHERGRVDGDSSSGAGGGVSKRQVLRETGMHWTTLEKILAHSEPPGYRRFRAASQPRHKPFAIGFLWRRRPLGVRIRVCVRVAVRKARKAARPKRHGVTMASRRTRGTLAGGRSFDLEAQQHESQPCPFEARFDAA